jgi:hypothetical protein
MDGQKKESQETQPFTAGKYLPEGDVTKAEDLEAWEILKAMRQPFLNIPPEEVAEETDRILAEIREENRRKRSKAKTEG